MTFRGRRADLMLGAYQWYAKRAAIHPKSKTGKKIFLQVNEPYYPVIAFVLNDTTFPLKQILSHLEKKDGYAIPAYQMGNISDIVMRMVFKPNVSHTEAYRLRDALKSAIQHIY